MTWAASTKDSAPDQALASTLKSLELKPDNPGPHQSGWHLLRPWAGQALAPLSNP